MGVVAATALAATSTTGISARPAGSARAASPCTVLTGAQIGKAFGGRAASPVVRSAGSGASVCKWTVTTGSAGTGGLEVEVVKSSLAGASFSAFAAYGRGPVSGLGAKSTWYIPRNAAGKAPRGAGGLAVLVHGTTLLNLIAAFPKASAKIKPALIALAKEGVGRV